MPLEYYAAQWRAGHLDANDVEQALAEISWPQSVPAVTTNKIFQILRDVEPSEAIDLSRKSQRSHPIRSVVDHAAAISSVNWHEIVTDELSKFCSAHYDDGQASWVVPGNRNRFTGLGTKSDRSIATRKSWV